MRNLFEEHPKLALGLMAGLVVGAFGLQYVLNSRRDDLARTLRETEGGRPEAVETKRLQEIRRIEYREPDKALALVEAVLQKPESAAEANAALEKHAAILQLCFHNRLKAGKLEEARGFMERLAGMYPSSFHVEGVRRAWAEERKKTCREHLRAGQFAEAKGILHELLANDWFFRDGQILGDYQKALIDAWVNAGAGEQAGFDLLLEAASAAQTLQPHSAPARALVDSRLSGARLVELADRERNGPARFRAIPFYQAALRRLNSGSQPWRAPGPDLTYQARQIEMKSNEEKLAGLFIEFVDALAKGARPMLIVQSAEEVCQEAAAQLGHQPFQTPLWWKLIELQATRLAQISKPALAFSLERLAEKDGLPHDEYNALNGALRESSNLASDILRVAGAHYWSSLVKDTHFNPWPLFPPEVQEEYAARRKKGEREEHLRDALASRAPRADSPAPLKVLSAVRQLQCEINARRGLMIYSVQPDEFASWTRLALAENTDDELRTSIHAAATQAMLNCRVPSKFKIFYSLTGFFVSQIGLENLAPGQRTEFKIALEEAATGLASTERAQAIFLWAIQAEAYASEPAGAKARDAAVQGAFSLVAASPVERIAAEMLIPSKLKDLSVLSVENSTEHHLLVFYRGPETVIIASRPWRKSSAVLKDGQYEIAVIAPSGAIRPFHGQVTLQSAWRKSVYRVETTATGKKESAGSRGSDASGEYQLSRAPSGAGNFVVDAKTGAVSLAR